MPNLVEIAQTAAEVWRFFDFSRWRPSAILDCSNLKFLMVGRLRRTELPSWICCVCVRTTHEGHLVVFIAVQNLVGIGAVVLIICMFSDFASLAWGKIGKGWCDVDPNKLVLTFRGCYLCATFGESRLRNATVRVHTDRQTDRETDGGTLWQRQTEFIICPMPYAIVKNGSRGR